MFQFGSNKSRLQKKLTLFFILVTVVSISVSVEMILEFSAASFRDKIKDNLITEVQQGIPADQIKKIDIEKINSVIDDPISDFRNRMIFVLLVICANIFVAFKMFTNDIVSPMEKIVDSAKKIADGDLTVVVPVMSEDEIGQIAKLINDMNVNLTNMIVQIKQEIERHKNKIQHAADTISWISKENSDEIIEKKEMRISDFKKMLKLSKDIAKLHKNMVTDIDALETFIGMYKTYSIDGGGTIDIRQKELDKMLERI
ncbi:MAG: HAMP domain-containing protein [Leptospirales bacterium]|nr:HAMP domain-containing protein [Leptospirales bacterium]